MHNPADYQKQLELERKVLVSDVKRFESLLHDAYLPHEVLDDSIEELRAIRRRVYHLDQRLSKLNK